ncbi:hypothetical protein M405DRAFT_808882 [Rhizopogon salebrosus TDB-379]|nr:hypothetical protein M405DRAFT_808882 [Rhizopogon salebrosus TDB-379]
MTSDTPGLPGGGIHALRCVVREPLFQTVIYTSPQLLLSRQCAMAALGPIPSGLKFGNWLIWYSLSKPATIHPTSPSLHCES